MLKMFVIDDVHDKNDYNDNIVDNFDDDVNVYHCLDGFEEDDNVAVMFICWCYLWLWWGNRDVYIDNNVYYHGD